MRVEKYNETDGTTVDEIVKKWATPPKPPVTELLRFLAALFRSTPGLQCVQGCGYTPGFNDGDPCVHSHEVHANAGTRYADSFFTDKGEEVGLREELEQTVLGCGTVDEIEARWTAELAVAQAAINRVPGLFEATLGTDWVIHATYSEADGVELRIFDYDCGY